MGAGTERNKAGGEDGFQHGVSPVDLQTYIRQNAPMSEPMPPQSGRADQMLVALGHFDSRSAARAAIEAGFVSVNGAAIRKPSQRIQAGDAIVAQAVHDFVSRGALKLTHALDTFGIDPAGRHCLDIGASTGGFSEVLLRQGAARVVAVDVGQGQLHPRLRHEPRLVSLERQDARTLTPDLVGPAPSLIVCDASFISLTKILGVPLGLASTDAILIGLFKPQFEVGRDHIGKGGIVRDGLAVRASMAVVETWITAQGWRIGAWTQSPIDGGDGNSETLSSGAAHQRHARSSDRLISTRTILHPSATGCLLRPASRRDHRGKP